MSGVAVVSYLLANYPTLTAIAPATQIFAGDMPLKTPLPALGVAKISRTERHTVSMGEPQRLFTERVQVTIKGRTYTQREALSALVRAACSASAGVVNAVDLLSILPDMEGPDDDDLEAFIYTGSRDFIVKWRWSSLAPVQLEDGGYLLLE